MVYWSFFVLAALCLMAALIPMLPVSHGIVRVFDFPRTQILALTAAAFVAALLTLPPDRASALLFLMLLAAIAIQVARIARFSPVWPRSVEPFSGYRTQTPTLKLLVSNVKQSNRNYQQLLDEIERSAPDIALFMEVDQDWLDALRPVSDRFMETLECPRDNTYGMALFSNFPLEKKAVRYLLNEHIPSFDCVVKLASQKRFRLVTLHPEPPLPTDDTIGRDAEISLVGLKVRNETLPVIVTGDLNDVAWSHTTRRFLRVSGLFDPREGRGQYNSFDARWCFLRWPLDHIFHSSQFRLVSMKRLAFVGSDHFPMFYELALVDDNRTTASNGENSTRSDIEEARELVDVEKARDRKPIGEDWEDG